MAKDIPSGHERSFKRGVSDSLLDDNNRDYDGKFIPFDLPSTQKDSYKMGRKEGDALRKQIGERIQ